MPTFTTSSNISESSKDSATELLNELNLDVTTMKPADIHGNDHTVNLEDQLCETVDSTSNLREWKNTPECTSQTHIVVSSNDEAPENETLDLPLEERGSLTFLTKALQM